MAFWNVPLAQHSLQALSLPSEAEASTYHWYPQVDKTLQARVGPTLGCVRAGATATHFDSAGVLQTASANALRIDYDPVTLACKGALVEEDRTNLVLHSDDMDNAVWTASWGAAVTITGDQGDDAYGNTVAARYARGSGGNGGVLQNSITLAASTEYIASVVVENESAVRSSLLVWSNTDGAYVGFLQFNWTAGVPSTYAFTAGSDAVYDDWGNGRYRVSYKITSDSAGDYRFIIYPENAGSTGNSILVSSTDLQAGDFVTSHISTGAASVARAADDLSSTTLSWLDSADSAVGTLYARISFFGTNNGRVLQIDDGGNTNVIKFIRDPSLQAAVTTLTTSGANGNPTGDTMAADGTEYTMVCGYALNDVNLAMDGTLYTPDTVATLPVNTTFTTFTVGNRNNSANYWNGHIQEIIYWPERKPDAVLKAYSNQIFGRLTGSQSYRGGLAGVGGIAGIGGGLAA